MHIGQRIKQIVDKSRITNKELADRVGTSENNIYKIYNKEHVGTEILAKISSVLNVEIQKFFESGEAPVNESSITQSVASGSRNVQVVGTYQECMSELVAAQQAIIAEKDKTYQLQQQIIDLLKEQKK